MKNYTYVTTLSTDNYLCGVLMLNLTLKQVKSRYPLFVLCSHNLSQETMAILKRNDLQYSLLTEHIQTPSIELPEDHAHWQYTFDKLFVWTLTQFDKVVYLDSDMQIVQNIDDLFDHPHMSAVIADKFAEPGLTKLNSGLMVIEPDIREFEGMKSLLASGLLPGKNVGDQDLIRLYYSEWGNRGGQILPSEDNVLYMECDSRCGYINKSDINNVRVIHYIGVKKPWMMSPRAIYRRVKNNFLGKYLVMYYLWYVIIKLRLHFCHV